MYALLLRGGIGMTLNFGKLTLSLAPTRVAESASGVETVKRIDRLNVLNRLVASKAQEKGAELESEAARVVFHRKLEAVAEPLSFANVALLALVLALLFHRRRPMLVEHAVFSMHLVSFILLSTLALKPILWLVSPVLTLDRAAGAPTAEPTLANAAVL